MILKKKYWPAIKSLDKQTHVLFVFKSASLWFHQTNKFRKVACKSRGPQGHGLPDPRLFPFMCLLTTKLSKIWKTLGLHFKLFTKCTISASLGQNSWIFNWAKEGSSCHIFRARASHKIVFKKHWEKLQNNYAQHNCVEFHATAASEGSVLFQLLFMTFSLPFCSSLPFYTSIRLWDDEAASREPEAEDIKQTPVQVNHSKCQSLFCLCLKIPLSVSLSSSLSLSLRSLDVSMMSVCSLSLSFNTNVSFTLIRLLQ